MCVVRHSDFDSRFVTACATGFDLRSHKLGASHFHACAFSQGIWHAIQSNESELQLLRIHKLANCQDDIQSKIARGDQENVRAFFPFFNTGIKFRVRLNRHVCM